MANANGLSLGSILATVFCVVVLGGLLLPLTRGRSDHARQPCANNLKQLVTAMVAYDEEHGALGSFLVVVDSQDWVNDPLAARRITNRSFEFLAAHFSLPNQLFICRKSGHQRPTVKPELGGGTAWDGSTSYAYDWGAPSGSPTHRPTLSDRSPLHHSGRSLVAAGDGSVRIVRQQSNAARGQRTSAADGQSVTAVMEPTDPAIVGDNLYDDAGDDENGRFDALVPGRGSPTRCWVK